MTINIEILSKKHNRTAFESGKDLLDNYFHFQVGQDVRRQLSACFVWEDLETELIKGYYTLANNSISLNDIPEKWRKKLPKTYLSIPTTLIARLAVDLRFQGIGVGKILLIDALIRSFEISKNIASFAVVVDPLDKDAELFYEKFGFVKLPDSGKMFLAMQTLKMLFDLK